MVARASNRAVIAAGMVAEATNDVAFTINDREINRIRGDGRVVGFDCAVDLVGFDKLGALGGIGFGDDVYGGGPGDPNVGDVLQVGVAELHGLDLRWSSVELKGGAGSKFSRILSIDKAANPRPLGVSSCTCEPR